MATASSQQPNSNAAITATEKTVLWVEAVVRWAKDDFAEIRLLPDLERGNALTQIQRGDLIQVRIDLRHVDWVPCRYGHITGWLNIRHVRLIQTGAPPTKEVVHIDTASPHIDSKSDGNVKGKKRNIIQRLVSFFTS